MSSYSRLQRLREISADAPGLLIVDGDGKPVGRWQGALTPSQEKEIETLYLKLRGGGN